MTDMAGDSKRGKILYIYMKCVGRESNEVWTVEMISTNATQDLGRGGFETIES